MNEKLGQDRFGAVALGGSQMGTVKFDYSRWQRTENPSAAKGGPKAGVFTVQPGPGSRHTRPKVPGKNTCKHGRRKAVNKKEDIAAVERMCILQLRIHARRNTLEHYTQREQQLLAENTKLQQEIENIEGTSHQAAKTLLRKYEKIGDGVNILHDKFSKDMSSVQKQLEHTRSKVETKLQALQLQVDETDEQLEESKAELSFYLSYKDKEYPVKALEIFNLQKEISVQNQRDQDEEADLARIVESELEKLKSGFARTKREVTQDVTERKLKARKCACVRVCVCGANFLSLVHPSFKDMAAQNITLEKELEVHKAEVIELESSIEALKGNIRKLLQENTTRNKQRMFPDVFLDRPKCKPDAEVVPDIPTKTWLPV